MKDNRMMDQVTAIFGLFMTVFYIGIGYYIAFVVELTMDKTLKTFFGFMMILYGLYRGFRTYQKLKETFFNRDKDDKAQTF